MFIPTRNHCLTLMDRVEMPHHIRRHSFIVTEVALYLGRRLNRNHTRLKVELIEAGALLHDIAKGRCILTGENHAQLGAKMLEDLGYMEVARIVEEHVQIDDIRLRAPISESIIVNYADKRVKHDEIVTLEDRFLDLMDRYGKTPQHKARIKKKLELFLRLEEKIFDHLSVTPADLMRLNPKDSERMGEV